MKYLTKEVLKANENPVDTLEEMGGEIRGAYIFFEEIAIAHFRRIADSFLFEGDRWLFGFEKCKTVIGFIPASKGWWMLSKLETNRNIYFTDPEEELDRTICFMYK